MKTNEAMKELKEAVTLAGKVVEGVKYPDSTGQGFSILFTDGTILNIYERMQAGAIVVTYEGQELQDDEEDNYD